MNEEHKEELRQEYLQELREEPMRIWIDDNLSELEGEFIETFPPEDRPLDDDIPDFIDSYCDEFEDFCRIAYNEDW